jgi:endonuclease/exonuclease/phosphatase family metal-dependent hydrolase
MPIRTLLRRAIILLLIAGVAAIGLIALALTATPPVMPAALALRAQMPQTENYTDPSGPLAIGRFAPGPATPGRLDSARLIPDELVVVTYNLRYGEAISETVAAFQTAEPLPAADFILLQEMDEAGVVALAQALGYDYAYAPASVAEDGDDFGNAILSRWPLREARKIILPGLHPLSGQQRTATRATARVGDEDLLLYSTHIEIATAPVALRVGQMAAVLADVPDAAERVIIGGDFNTITARGVAALAEQYAAGGLDHATPGLGPTFTRFGLRPSAADHLFTRGFDVLDAGVLGDVSASDHFPVWARLSWQ